MKKNVNLILFRLRERSSYKLYAKNHKCWLRLPQDFRMILLSRQVRTWFGPNVKKSDKEIRKAQDEFLNYEYRGE